MKKAFFIGLMSALVVTMLVGCADSEEMTAAKEAFNAEAERVASQSSELEESIAAAELALQEEGRPLDESTISSLEEAIASAKAIEIASPSMPMGLEAIQDETARLETIDYSRDIELLSAAQSALEDSREQRRLVTAPAESYVVEKLGEVADIDGIAAVTEDNDPNGNLNKPGGYTAQVYFTSPLVDQARVYGTTVIEKGTVGGGSVEVYATEEEAEKRNSYLASFDGSIFASGTHRVVGTLVVRVSNEMTASQQSALESAIVAALTSLEES